MRHTADIAASYPALEHLDENGSRLSTLFMRRCEVEAFVRLHGLSVKEACELTGLDIDDWNDGFLPRPQSRITHLPLPSEIEELCLGFQAGWTDGDRADRRGGINGERLGKVAANPVSPCPQEF
ncbi:MAG: hypothetical protein GY904_07290 [Planctomycetaceae bacterium]|nr:hypothetical protein [Planctomycetaceae bacterium]